MIAKQSIGKSFTGALNYNLKKIQNSNPKERAELLTTNFTAMDPAMIRKELAIMKAMNPKLKRNTYHTSLNFAVGEKISNQKMQQVAEEYLKKMGFDNNLHIIFRHHDSNHPHCHIPALRNRFDGSVVSDSNNYQRSEQVIREMENKYKLVKVQGSKQSKNKAPNKDEIEMILRTRKPSKKLILQEKVREALNKSITMKQFIDLLERNHVHVLFNQASTGRVSGITYLVPGFKIRGQALGNQFKFGSITKQINYEQNRDNKTISQANSRTQEKFDGRNKAFQATRGFGSRSDPKWDRYHTFQSKKNNGFPTTTSAGQGQYYGNSQRHDQSAGPDHQGAKANPMDLDNQLHSSCDSHIGAHHIFSNLLPDTPIIPEKDSKKKQEEKRKLGRGF